MMTADVAFSEDVFIVTKETAEAYLKGRATPPPPAPVPQPPDQTGRALPSIDTPALTPLQHSPSTAAGLTWTGEIAPQKWMNFYTKVLSKFASGRGLKLTLKVEVTPEGGVSKQKLDETKSALRELGLNDDVSPK
jgi:hypothetical protein